MIDCDDCVTLSDDDNVVEICSPKLHKNFHSIETVDLDEELERNTTLHNINVIEVPDSQGSTDDNKFVKTIQKIQNENRLFAQFIDKCLDLENSDGMMRIIEKNILKNYEQCDKAYTRSEKFYKVLTKAMRKLDTDPIHKFSHVKNLVDVLKSNKLKKRAQLTTLATNLKENAQKSNRRKRNKTSYNCITLDSDEEHKDDDVICLDEGNDLEAEKENQQTQNETNVAENALTDSPENFLVPHTAIPYEPSQEFIPQVVQIVLPIEYQPAAPTIDMDKVKSIENEIAYWKKIIQVMEEKEVEDDNSTSPYVLCESYKAKVVQLYQELCSLVGEQPVKRRKVRLKVLEGHPPGPVKRLEQFINNNIGEDGAPLFPDFYDVVKCVVVANLEDKLGWNKQQVMREANALFTQCGRALQRKRQKREYRDLLAHVKEEAQDPADQDPELLRKLEQNRKTAVRKELDLLERYAVLQDQPKPPSGSNSEINQNQSFYKDLSQEPSSTSHGNEIIVNKSSKTINIDSVVNFPHEDTHAISQSKSEEAILTQNINNHTEDVCGGNEGQVEQPQLSPHSECLSDEDSDFEPPEIPLSQELTENNLNKTDNDSKIDGESEVKIKQEPIDIAQMLEDLGTGYTTSLDILDPFLVIEISSDSSDDEMVVDGED